MSKYDIECRAGQWTETDTLHQAAEELRELKARGMTGWVITPGGKILTEYDVRDHLMVGGDGERDFITDEHGFRLDHRHPDRNRYA